MAGNTLARELTQPGAARFAVATPEDDPAIRRLLRDNPMQGAISLTFEREPDYFRGASLAGGEDETIVAFSGGRLVCMGRCSRRDCWVNSRIAKVGYLAELRLDAAARGRFDILREGYAFFHERALQCATELYFTSISADNERARRLLERGLRGMPSYGFLAELVTLLVSVPRRSSGTQLRVMAPAIEDIPGMLRVLNEHARRYELAAVWTEKNLLSLARRGLPLERFLVAREGGAVVAVGALWDQRPFRQTVVRKYAPKLTFARPFINLAAGLLGTPRLPAPGSILALAFLSPLAFAEGAEALLPEFVEAFFPMAAKLGVRLLTVALPEHDERMEVLRRRFSTRVYRSRLYRVERPGEEPVAAFAQQSTFLPDVALL